MRIAATVFATIVLIGTTLTPALALDFTTPIPPCRSTQNSAAIDAQIAEFEKGIASLENLLKAAKSAQNTDNKNYQTLRNSFGKDDPRTVATVSLIMKDNDRVDSLNTDLGKARRHLAALKAVQPCTTAPPVTTPAAPVTPGPVPAPSSPPPPQQLAPPKPPATGGVLVPGAPAPVNTTGRVAYYNSPLEAWFYNTPYYNSPFEAWFYNTPYNTPIGGSVWDGFYIGVGGGASFVPTVTATEFFSDGKDRFPWGSDTGFYFGAQAGLQFGNWRAEGQYTWSRNPAAATMPLPSDFKIGGDTEAFGFFGNAIYTPPFTLGIPVTPHIGVGIGALNVTTKVKFNDITVFNSSGWAPGVQVIGGLTYTISPKWTIDLDYRYQTTLSDVEYRTLPIAGSDIRNRVTAPYAAHYITLGLNLHFPVASRPPAPASPPPPARKSEIPQAHQVAALTPVETAAAAAHRFTLHYDEANAVLTSASVRSLHDALDAIEAGQDVRIVIAGCETDADYADRSLCARHALRLRHLLARYGVANPDHLLVRG